MRARAHIGPAKDYIAVNKQMLREDPEPYYSKVVIAQQQLASSFTLSPSPTSRFALNSQPSSRDISPDGGKGPSSGSVFLTSIEDPLEQQKASLPAVPGAEASRLEVSTVPQGELVLGCHSFDVWKHKI